MDPAKALKELFCRQQSLPLAKAIEEVLTKYLAEIKLAQRNGELASDMSEYLNYVRQAPLGALVKGFTFKAALSSELQEFFKIISLREHHQLKAPCALLENVNFRLLEENYSPKVVFEQACRLERALKQHELTPHHASLAQDNLISLIQKLYPKLAELIVKAKNADGFKTIFERTFDGQQCVNLEEVAFAFDILQQHVTFLTTSGFLEKFYAFKRLDKKEQYVRDYLHYIQELKNKPAFLSDTLNCLLDQICLVAYAPCQKKQEQLIDDPRSTIRDVIDGTNLWTEAAWEKYEGSKLIDILNDFLDYDLGVLENWGSISNLHRPATPRPGFNNQDDSDAWEAEHSLPSPASLPAFEVLSFKYSLNNPNIDPATLLQPEEPPVDIPRPSTPSLDDALAPERPPAPELNEEEAEAIAFYNELASLHLGDNEVPTKRERSLSF